MKTLLATLIMSLVIGNAFADSLRVVIFRPPGKIIAYRQAESGFRYNFHVEAESLTVEQQAAISGAMAWLGTQLAEGETVDTVVLEQEGAGFSAAVSGGLKIIPRWEGNICMEIRCITNTAITSPQTALLPGVFP